MSDGARTPHAGPPPESAPAAAQRDAVIGVGWAFPVALDARRRMALARGVQEIEQAMLIILLTSRGQRPRRPEFGCAIHDLIFAPNNSTTAGLAEYYVREALMLWEPRIDVDTVSAVADDKNPERLMIKIGYTIKATSDRRSLVFPFYRIPEE
jgi:phage baseplate assembly protein W